MYLLIVTINTYIAPVNKRRNYDKSEEKIKINLATQEGNNRESDMDLKLNYEASSDEEDVPFINLRE
jgi:hypothetical protein